MEYLVPEQVRRMAVLCRTQVAALLSVRAVTGRPGARQWSFFKDAVERLLTPGHVSEFDSIPPTQAAQYKFEVEAKLRKHYGRTRQPSRLIFSLIHRKDLSRKAVANPEIYPTLAGYCVLVQDRHAGSLADSRPSGASERLERKAS